MSTYLLQHPYTFIIVPALRTSAYDQKETFSIGSYFGKSVMFELTLVGIIPRASIIEASLSLNALSPIQKPLVESAKKITAFLADDTWVIVLSLIFKCMYGGRLDGACGCFTVIINQRQICSSGCSLVLKSYCFFTSDIVSVNNNCGAFSSILIVSPSLPKVLLLSISAHRPTLVR